MLHNHPRMALNPSFAAPAIRAPGFIFLPRKTPFKIFSVDVEHALGVARGFINAINPSVYEFFKQLNHLGGWLALQKTAVHGSAVGWSPGIRVTLEPLNRGMIRAKALAQV